MGRHVMDVPGQVQAAVSETERVFQAALSEAEFRGYLRGLKFLSDSLSEGTPEMKILGSLLSLRIQQEEQDFYSATGSVKGGLSHG